MGNELSTPVKMERKCCLKVLSATSAMLRRCEPGGDKFVRDLVVGDQAFECLGGFVVEDVLVDDEPCVPAPVDEDLVCALHLGIGLVFHRLNECVVAVDVYHDHEVLVAFA